MKHVLIISLCLLSIAGFADTQEQKLAALKTQLATLQQENQKLKAQLEQKDRLIKVLTDSISNRNRVAPSSRSGRVYSSRSGNTSASTAENPRLAMIKKRIASLEKKKAALEKDYRLEGKKLKDAGYIIRRDERKEAIKRIEDNQKRIRNEISDIEDNITGLLQQSASYK